MEEAVTVAPLNTVNEAVTEIKKMRNSLPLRPEFDEIVKAKNVTENADKECRLTLENISKRAKGDQVPEELFLIIQKLQKNIIRFRCEKSKKKARILLDLEDVHKMYDDLVAGAYECVTDPSSSSALALLTSSLAVAASTSRGGASAGNVSRPIATGPSTSSSSSSIAGLLFTGDDTYVGRADASVVRSDRFGRSVSGRLDRHQVADPALAPREFQVQDGEKLTFLRLATYIEVCLERGIKHIGLRRRLLDQVDWLPHSIGTLSSLISLDLSENNIAALPDTIGGLRSLERLYLCANKISLLPDSIGDLENLVILDLRGNRLVSLSPAVGTLACLQKLDLSTNQLFSLPESIGYLVNLQYLTVDLNKIENLPFLIGECLSLKELRADYNRLRGLPEGVGKIRGLEVLSVRYNYIRKLPISMWGLKEMREFDASNNELEALPDCLCCATSLVRLSVGGNFADLRRLPLGIGDLKMLEELDISNNQIRVLPDSFMSLRNLRALNVRGTPLEVPPGEVAERGAQAVVEYMANYVARRGASTSARQSRTLSPFSCFKMSNR